jgi:hypothetical protein
VFAPFALLVKRQSVIVQFANPLSFWPWRTHTARATVLKGWGLFDAHRFHATELTAETTPVIADARRT